jgi:hypothetical protein
VDGLFDLQIVINLEKAIRIINLSSPKAYLDPGSGSFILQLILATLLGGLFLIRGYWTRVKSFFSRLLHRDGEDKKK